VTPRKTPKIWKEGQRTWTIWRDFKQLQTLTPKICRDIKNRKSNTSYVGQQKTLAH